MQKGKAPWKDIVTFVCVHIICFYLVSPMGFHHAVFSSVVKVTTKFRQIRADLVLISMWKHIRDSVSIPRSLRIPRVYAQLENEPFFSFIYTRSILQ